MRVSTTLAIIFTTAVVTASSAQALQLSDGTIFFAVPPQLITATTTFETVGARDATYYFTLSIPENAGEPLQQVTIAQRGGTQEIKFALKDTTAFLGTRRHQRQGLSLAGVTKEKKAQLISVTFNPPVSPGNTVTISLSPYQNPLFSGVYLFGVTAFPVGEKPHGQFLGFGRLQFYDRGGVFP